MLFLKQSTAAQSVLIGPFVDATDGSTAETGLTIANTDIRLSKNGGNIAAKNSGGGTHDELGYYTITFDATDTDTVGRLQLAVHVAGALPVYHEFHVLEEAVYDALMAASALGYVANAPVNVAQFGGAAGTFSGGRPEVNTSHVAGTAQTAGDLAALIAVVDGVVDAILVDTADIQPKIGTPAGASVSADVAAVKGDTAAILADTGTDGVVVAAGSKTGYSLSAAGIQAIWDALTSALTTVGSVGKLLVDNLNATISSRLASASYTAPLDAAGVRAAVGLAAANLDTQLAAIDDFLDTEIAAILAAVDTEVAAILADTAELQGDWVDGGRLDLILDARASQASVDTIDDLVDDLETRLTAALATKLAAHAAGVLTVTIGSGASTTSIPFSAVEGTTPSATNDHYNGRVLVITSGALAGQATNITDYDGATATATVAALTGAPANGVTAIIV